MSFLKDVKEIKQTLNELKEASIGNLEKRSKRADELENYLSKVRINLKKVSDITLQNGKSGIRIIYDMPQIILELDDNGEIIPNDTFTAINMLDLLNMNDLIYLSRIINSKKKLNK